MNQDTRTDSPVMTGHPNLLPHVRKAQTATSAVRMRLSSTNFSGVEVALNAAPRFDRRRRAGSSRLCKRLYPGPLSPAIPRFEDVRLIPLTGYGQAEDRQRAGFDDQFVKPSGSLGPQPHIHTSWHQLT
jgi:hypothetical protein